MKKSGMCEKTEPIRGSLHSDLTVFCCGQCKVGFDSVTCAYIVFHPALAGGSVD